MSLMQGDPHTKMTDSSDESLKFLFSENRVLYWTILSTFATSKSKWQIYCFDLVLSLSQGPKSDLPPFPACQMVSAQMFL